MKLRIHVKNALTKEVEIDSTIEIINEDIEIIRANHNVFYEVFPDCHVNFEWPSSNVELFGTNFIGGVPRNMELDQAKIDTGEMSWQSYMKKWHNMDVEYSAMPSLN
jgi:hypothetical protein